MTLPVGDHTDTSQVSTSSHHAQVTWEGAGGGKSTQYIGIISGSSGESIAIQPVRTLPVSNLMKSVILPVSRSIRTVSLTLMRGSG